MAGEFENKVALITGAAGNLGSAAARRFAQGGARLALVGRDVEQLVAFGAELGVEALAVSADLSKADEVNAMVEQIEVRFGQIDILAHTVGGFASGKAVSEGDLAILVRNRELSLARTMKIPQLPFTTTDWSQVPSTEHSGETGSAFWRTLNIGDVRVRMVEYTPGYLADHWCDRGHILYVLEGELDTELRDGRTFKLKPGMSYQVSDFGDAAHRSSTRTGTKLFIVD